MVKILLLSLIKLSSLSLLVGLVLYNQGLGNPVYPDPVLIKKAIPVQNIDGKVKMVVDRMAELMCANKGIGLAAPQLGISRQIIVVDIGQGLKALINPEIIEGNGESILEEGCLSLPNIEVPVKRKRRY